MRVRMLEQKEIRRAGRIEKRECVAPRAGTHGGCIHEHWIKIIVIRCQIWRRGIKHVYRPIGDQGRSDIGNG